MMIIITLTLSLIFFITSSFSQLPPIQNQSIYTVRDSLYSNSTFDDSDANPCNWQAPYMVVDCDQNQTTITKIQFMSYRIFGRLPSEIGNFPNLEGLTLQFAPGLFGEIPTEIGMLRNATYLIIAFNENINGKIPTEIGLMTSLTLLSLTSAFEGLLPTEIANLPNLQDLQLHSDSLIGTIPTEFGLLPSVTSISIGGVHMTGTLPTELGMMSNNLTSLSFSTNNFLGPIPTEYALLRGLNQFLLYDCKSPLIGPFPNISFPSLTSLTIQKCAVGDIPVEFLNSITTVSLTLTNMTKIPKVTDVLSLTISESNPLGTIPSEIFSTNLQNLQIFNTELSGSIPTEISLANNLTSISLMGASLEGTLPTELGLLTLLSGFFVGNNFLTGTVPSELIHSESLEFLNLAGNYFEGPLTIDFQTYSANWIFCYLLPNNFDCPYPNVPMCSVFVTTPCNESSPLPTPAPTPEPTPSPTPNPTPRPPTHKPTLAPAPTPPQLPTTIPFVFPSNSTVGLKSSTISIDQVELWVGIGGAILVAILILIVALVCIIRKVRQNQETQFKSTPNDEETLLPLLDSQDSQTEQTNQNEERDISRSSQISMDSILSNEKENSSVTSNSSSTQSTQTPTTTRKRNGTIIQSLSSVASNHTPLIESLTNDFGSEFYLKNVHKGQKLGAGNFGEVFVGTYREGKVAIKTLQAENVKSMKEEVRIATVLNSPIVVRVFGVTVLEGSMFVVMEYCENGSLLDWLRKSNVTQISKIQTLIFACRVASAVQLLQENNIIHRDLAARNFLLTESLEVKLSDFGMARQLNKTYYKDDTTTVPVRWCAPEVLTHSRYTLASDRYALGVTLWEIFTLGRTPFVAFANQDIVESAEDFETFPRLAKGDMLNDEEIRVVLGLTEPKANQRMEMREAHNSLTNILETLKIMGTPSITPKSVTPAPSSTNTTLSSSSRGSISEGKLEEQELLERFEIEEEREPEETPYKNIERKTTNEVQSEKEKQNEKESPYSDLFPKPEKN